MVAPHYHTDTLGGVSANVVEISTYVSAETPRSVLTVVSVKTCVRRERSGGATGAKTSFCVVKKKEKKPCPDNM